MHAVMILLVLVLILILYIKKKMSFDNLKHLPTYPQYPLIGSAHLLRTGGKAIIQRLIEGGKKSDEKQLPAFFLMGPVPMIYPEETRIVTNTFLDKPYIYGFTLDLGSKGIIAAPGEIWKKKIKSLGNSFTSKIVDGYQHVFNDQCRKMADQIKEYADGKNHIDVMENVLEGSFETICRLIMGNLIDSDKTEFEEYYETFKKILRETARRLCSILDHADLIYSLTPSYKRMKKLTHIVKTFATNITMKRIAEREKGSEQKNPKTTKRIFKSYLDNLIDISETDSSYTLEQISHEINSAVGAGFDTVASTIFFTLYLLGCNMDIQNKLYTEIKSVFADKRDVTKEDLQSLKYCDAVIKETLRLMPATPVVARKADREFDIGSCVIPKGAFCLLNILGSGRSKRLWGEDAECFRPERWLNGSESGLELMTFSVGKRACFGQKYAMAFMKTAVIHYVRDYEFFVDDLDLELTFEVVMKPSKGHLMKVKLR